MKHRKIRKGVFKYIPERLSQLIENDTDEKNRERLTASFPQALAPV